MRFKSLSRAVFFSVLLFVSLPSFSIEAASPLDRQIVTFFQNTKNFHRTFVLKLEEESFFYPSDYVVTLKSNEDGTSVRHYFEVNYYSEYYPREETRLVTVPYYSFTSNDNLYTLSFCLAFPLEETENMYLINDKILGLSLDGTIDVMAQGSGFLKKIAFFHPHYKLDMTAIAESLVILLLVVVNIILVIWYTFISRRTVFLSEQKNSLTSLRCRELALEKAEEIHREITDPLTLLYTSDYLKTLIQKEIAKYNTFSKGFCVALFIVQDKGDSVELRKISGVIRENLSAHIISAYKGNGVFVSFFPEKTESEISIFVDLTVEKIYEMNVPVVSRIHEYYGQEDFLSSIGI